MPNLRKRFDLVLLLGSLLATPAWAQISQAEVACHDAPCVGLGLTSATNRVPYGMIAQVAAPLARRGPFALGVAGAVRWTVFGVTFRSFPESPELDSSRIGVLGSAALRGSLAITSRAITTVDLGVATGSWKTRPVTDPNRPRITVPLAAASVIIRMTHRIALEMSAFNVRNVYQGDDVTGGSILVTVPLRR